MAAGAIKVRRDLLPRREPMKRTPKRIMAQFNLLLMSTPTSTVTIIPQEKQEELRVALIDLLISAASPGEESLNHTAGGANEHAINS
jgi:hypothetical protein